MPDEPAERVTKMIDDPATPLWRGAIALRIVTFLFAAANVIANQSGQPGYERPWLAWTTLGVMALWSVFTSRAYSTTWGRRWPVVLADLALTCGLMSLSPLIMSDHQLLTLNVPLITTIWASVPAVALGALGGAAAGFVGGLTVGLFTYLSKGVPSLDLLRDVVLLAGAGMIVGMASATARRSAVRLAQALRAEAATAERERLARSIHDSVLQVLARVRKRGLEVGGEAAELAQLAGEQEVALRNLVAAAPADSTVDGEVDLRPGLQLLATPRVQVSTPATQVMLAAATAGELTSLVREALSNVDKHAGPGARAWVLLEDLGDEVVLSVRDDGPGIPDGRIASAAAEGRMGIEKSIKGRVEALGGALELQTGPGEGTEWEVRVFREGAAR
ncbi:Signal transduction histidine kinase [Lentzea xinjiangensis]|uniref:Signal transduction histidine kinase n=2 Tax=Lentzea xinjiangensis TaxID=402600 RepID=A0A1H9A1W2_9PSEU|nr:Signal transduction histidine kinase [Lentzea xinjiangensis]